MILSVFVTDDETEGPHFVGDFGTIADALTAGKVLLLRWPRIMVDVLSESGDGKYGEGTLEFCMYRETVHDNYITVIGNVNGQIDITEDIS